MNVNNTVQTNHSVLKQPVSVKETRDSAANFSDPLNEPLTLTNDTELSESERVVKLSSAHVFVESFENRNQFNSLDRSSNNQPPTQQYQINQQLTKRDEIGSLLGVDVFA